MIPEVSTHASFVSILTESIPFLTGSFSHVTVWTRLYQTQRSCASVCLPYTLPVSSCHRGPQCLSTHIRIACEAVVSKTSLHSPMPEHTPSSLRTLSVTSAFSHQLQGPQLCQVQFIPLIAVASGLFGIQ